jgi:acyl-CoA synthetase (AMP-forming)/AMP-acid ligase II
MAQWPHARFCNVYGPTETNGVTYHLVPPLKSEADSTADRSPADETPLPIGVPYGNVEALVVGADDAPVLDGETGELVIRAPSMMQGYWNQPDLNATAFYHRPAFEHFNDVFYRTGDLVRRDDDGVYHFLGRKDRQIKTRGYRVELTEVEAALLRHPAVQGAAAYVVPDANGSQHIEASITLSPDAKTRTGSSDNSSTEHAVDETAIRGEAARYLPSYALPERIAIIERFPRTSTGKIDYQTLREHAASTAAAAPSG